MNRDIEGEIYDLRSQLFKLNTHRMTDQPEYEYSPLTRTLTEGGRSIEVYIFREKGAKTWFLEVVDDHDHSSVWEESFTSDAQALGMVQRIIREEGFVAFLGPGPDDEEEVTK